VDISNLHRQVLFETGDEGKPKALAARERLSALNPDISVIAYEEELTDKNVIGLFSGYDIIIDGTDNFAAKFLINDAAVKLGKPVIYAAIQGFEGQVSVFDAARGPCYRCLHPRPPEAQVMNCAEAGVIGALAGIAGTMQAMEAIKLIAAHESFKPLIGRLWMIDARTMESRVLAVPKRKDCPVCSRPAAEIIPEYSSPVCSLSAVMEINCDDAVAVAGDAVFIDVRERDEWDAGHIQDARHLPLSALQKNTDIFAPPERGRCVIYCQKGARSRKAAELLLRAGFTDIYSLRGGYEAWRAAGK
jgi:adenylyltransferase/sulfurtransferase